MEPRKTITLGTHCLVCGLDLGKELTDGALDDTCWCCGAQVGYTYTVDGDPEGGAKDYRQDWLDNGAQWDCQSSQPENWNKEMALAQIKANVPEEFQ